MNPSTHLVLVVEDDPGVATLELDLLEELGCQTCQAVDGASAVQRLRETTPSLMLLDYSLPDMTGVEMLNQLEQEGITAPPFIATTGAGDEQVAVELMKRGARDYLVKDSVFFETLEPTVQRTLKEITANQRLEQAEHRLEVELTRYRTILDTTPDAFITLDTHGCLSDANNACCQLTGYPRKALIGHSVSLLEPDDSGPHLHASIPQIIKTGSARIESALATREGKIVEVEISAAYCAELGIIAFIRDITSRKRIERTHKMNGQRLDGMLALSQHDTSMDEKALLHAGLACIRQMTHSDSAYYAFIDEETQRPGSGGWSDADNLAHPIELAVERLQSDAGGWSDAVRERKPIIHNRFDTPEEARRCCPIENHPVERLLSVPIIDQGTVRMVLGVCNKRAPYDQDDAQQVQLAADDLWKIVSRRRIAAALEEARGAAEAANRAKSAFLANMSHELRTPLNAVLGFAQVLEQSGTLGGTQLEQIRRIHRGGDYLLALINDILDLSKIEAKRFELFTSDWQPRPFFSDIAELFRMRADVKGLTLRLELDPDLPEKLHNDTKRLRQVVMNLLANAIKFTDRGEILLSVSHQKGTLSLRVKDTGIGIAKEEFGRLFKPFQQSADDRYRVQGTGLGLAISKELTREMGGTIDFRSTLGEGTTFYVKIPSRIVRVKQERRSAPETTGCSHYRRISGEGPVRVMVVDDSSDNRAVIQDLLTPLDFDVSAAIDGQECLEKASQSPPDLILMDLRMPRMNGIEATRAIRADPALAQIPVVALSAGASEEDRQESIAAGCNLHLAKPVDLAILQKAFAQLLPLVWEGRKPTAEPKPAPTEAHLPPSTLPVETLEHLEELLKRGKLWEIQTLASELAENNGYPEAAQSLTQLVDSFDLIGLRKFVETHRQ